MNDHILYLNMFELGCLVGATQEVKDRFPESLNLKIQYLSTSAYANHETLGKQARQEMKALEEKMIAKGIQFEKIEYAS